MDLRRIIEKYQGVTVTVVTSNPAAPVAVGEVLDGCFFPGALGIKLTANYDSLPAGATVFFNPTQIVSVG